MAPVSLKLLVLKTPQMDKVRTFYQTIGISLSEEKHARGPLHYAGQIGEGVFEAYPLSDERVDKTTRLGLGVTNLTEAVDTLQVIGAVVVTKLQETPWGYRAVVHDPY